MLPLSDARRHRRESAAGGGPAGARGRVRAEDPSRRALLAGGAPARAWVTGQCWASTVGPADQPGIHHTVDSTHASAVLTVTPAASPPHHEVTAAAGAPDPFTQRRRVRNPGAGHIPPVGRPGAVLSRRPGRSGRGDMGYLSPGPSTSRATNLEGVPQFQQLPYDPFGRMTGHADRMTRS